MPSFNYSSLLMAAVLVSGIGIATRSVEAQVTIQQPVVHSIGGQFGVVVPDRGGIFLGGVGRAGASRSSYGFGPFRGSSYGAYSEQIGMSAHVTIQDLREMDRQILDMAESRSRTNSSRPRGIAFTDFNRAPPAFRADTPARRYFGATDSGRITSSIRPARQPFVAPDEPPAPAPRRERSERVSRALDPDRSWLLGQEAEQGGNLIVAKLHYHSAAQYGSAAARQRLIELGEKPLARR